MKEKHKNGCNILIMTFTNLEKYVNSKKCLKQQSQPPPPPLSRTLAEPETGFCSMKQLGPTAIAANMWHYNDEL